MSIRAILDNWDNTNPEEMKRLLLEAYDGGGRRVWKFRDGENIPDGAVFLSSLTQTTRKVTVKTAGAKGPWHREEKMVPCHVVWHYFLVEA